MKPDEIAARWEEAIVMARESGHRRPLSVPVAEMRVMLDALTAARAENDTLRAENDEMGEMFDLAPLKRASHEQLWAEMDRRRARYARSQKVADLLRERARLCEEVSELKAALTAARAENERLRVAIEQARRLVSGCVGKWHQMVDELWQADPDAIALGGQLDVDRQLTRAQAALYVALAGARAEIERMRRIIDDEIEPYQPRGKGDYDAR